MVFKDISKYLRQHLKHHINVPRTILPLALLAWNLVTTSLTVAGKKNLRSGQKLTLKYENK